MDVTRTSSARRFAEITLDKWELVQVELQGWYSIERMRALHTYSIQTSWFRVLLWCIITPVPSLVINILLDVAPLAPPSAGRDANYIFWVRMTISTAIISFWSLIQTGYLAPTLGIQTWHALTIATVVTVTCTTTGYILSCLISMPVPFLLVILSPPFILTIAIMSKFYFGRKIQSDSALRVSYNRAKKISGLRFCLVFIFPAFIYGYNSLSSKYQTPYMALMPVIKFGAKNIMSRLVGSNHDLKSIELIFNVDCFNAIYVSLAMQRATTISTSLIVMVIDVIQGCVSMYDVYQSFKPLKRFMNGLSIDHPLRGKNFLEVAMALEQQENPIPCTQQVSNAIISGTTIKAKFIKPGRLNFRSSGMLTSAKVLVAPRQPACRDATGNAYIVQNLCSSENRVVFLDATRKLLFTTEFVVLVEYTEVIMPVFYSIVIAAEYYLPNRAFYSTIAGVDEEKLWSMVASILMYATLELLSLLALDLALRRITGVSVMRQVGFVLDTQRMKVQAKLLSWVVYAVQLSLDHFGADFSFQFKWLHSD